MGVRILHDQKDKRACLYDSVTGLAFGPTFCDGNRRDAAEKAEDYLEWLREKGPAPKAHPNRDHDARLYSQDEHWNLLSEFLKDAVT